MSLVKKFSKTKETCKVTFSLPKEAIQNGKNVILLGEFNNWNPKEGIAMINKKNGYETVIELAAGKKYEFRYLVDGQVWINDFKADAYVPNVFGTENSVVTIPASKKMTTRKTAAKVTKKATKKPVAKKVAKKAVANKLTKIEGIGPKIEGLLNAAGIKSFDDLGKSKVSTLRNILKDAGSRYQMHNPSTWAKQAKLAAKGSWDKLQNLQDELKGGKTK